MLYKHDIIYNFDKYYILIGLTLAIILTATAMVYYYCRVKPGINKTVLLILHSIILSVQTGQFLMLISSPDELIFFACIDSIGYCLVGTVFFLYTYIVFKNRLPNKLSWAGLFFIPAISLATVLSNNFHHLFFNINQTFLVKYGQVFILITCYNLLCLLGGGLFLLLHFRKNRGHGFIHQMPYFIGILLIAVVNGYETFGPRFGVYGLTPITISIGQLLFFLGNKISGTHDSIFYLRNKTLDCIDESIIITDCNNNILYCNLSKFNLDFKVRECKNTEELLSLLSEYALENTEVENLAAAVRNGFSGKVRGELILSRVKNNPRSISKRRTNFQNSFIGMAIDPENHSENRFFSYDIYPIIEGKDNVIGRLFVFRDVTDYRSLINRLNMRNLELAATHETLKKHTGISRRLVQENERRIIMDQISETVGDSIARIVKTLENLYSAERISPEEKTSNQERIAEAIAYARDGIGRIRKSVSNLKD